MLDFLKKKKKDDEDSSDNDMPGEGKFPPPEDAFKEPTPLNDTPTPGGLPPLDNPMPESPKPTESMSPSEPREPMSPSPGTPVQEHKPLSGDKAEIIIAKIDSLKSMLEVLNQRISNLEQKMDRRW